MRIIVFAIVSFPHAYIDLAMPQWVMNCDHTFDDGTTYDLRPLTRTAGRPDYVGKDKRGDMYFMNVCNVTTPRLPGALIVSCIVLLKTVVKLWSRLSCRCCSCGHVDTSVPSRM